MRHYETIFIVHPELSEEDTAACVEKFRGLLEKDGAFIVKEDHWGRRRLAYTVKKHTKGYFVLVEYGATGEAVDELERNFKIDEQVIRYLTVKIADSFDEEAMAQRKAEAEAAKAAGTPPPSEPDEVGDRDDDDDDDDDRDDDRGGRRRRDDDDDED
ncbi:MAG: 30S ribosomal protein S6 [Proteobacteria bacterium]|nr:30S ribosomal protein S6 [Pseudomonadota bacterium]MBU4276348.1 30S ribosomal protein S6 [Pseudomonadota bacterium]MBU4383687.1 30S ribosomal protein S6 [Pseudomonadota bacterium]MBU4604412.1 30S ribosomal protein S6 [Pseudomonadota bacterium]MCG2763909.1 30S ribosomal protein S6 [Desulfarculaceae bacterium]